MSRPLDRSCQLPVLGDVDDEAGEFWVENPMDMPKQGENLSAYERNKLYLNTGDGHFLDASFASNADIDSDSRGVIAADFDRDGASDLLVVSVGGGTLRLFQNRLPKGNHRVRIQLTGVQSNTAGIGARIIAECGGQQIVRDVFSPNGFAGQAPAETLLGVGESRKIDSLSIRWPTGITQVLEDVPVDRTITVQEGDDRYVTSDLAVLPAEEANGLD